MESKADATPEDGNSFNPIGRAMIALVLGISIVILLNLLNRSGQFALLSAFFGILHYGLLITLDWLFEHGGRKKPHHYSIKEEQISLREIIARFWCLFLSSALKALVGFLGLLLLRHQQSLPFAVINGVLGFLLCSGLFTLGLTITLLLIGYKMNFQPPVLDGRNGNDKTMT